MLRRRSFSLLLLLTSVSILAGCPNAVFVIPTTAPGAQSDTSLNADMPASGSLEPTVPNVPMPQPSSVSVSLPGQEATPVPVPPSFIATTPVAPTGACATKTPVGLIPTYGGTPAPAGWSMAAYDTSGALLGEDALATGTPPITFSLPVGCPVRLRLVKTDSTYTETNFTVPQARQTPFTVDFPNTFKTLTDPTPSSQQTATSTQNTVASPTRNTTASTTQNTTASPTQNTTTYDYRNAKLDCRIPAAPQLPDLVKLVPTGQSPDGQGWDADIIWRADVLDTDGNRLGEAELAVPVNIALDAYQGYGNGNIGVQWVKTETWNFVAEPESRMLTWIPPIIRMVPKP